MKCIAESSRRQQKRKPSRCVLVLPRDEEAQAPMIACWKSLPALASGTYDCTLL